MILEKESILQKSYEWNARGMSQMIKLMSQDSKDCRHSKRFSIRFQRFSISIRFHLRFQILSKGVPQDF